MPRKPMTAIDVTLRWMNVFLRGVHLAAVILLGAALLGATLSAAHPAIIVAGSGAIMFALDVWRKPRYLCEAAGVAMLGKLHKLRNLWHFCDPGGVPCECNTLAMESGAFTG